MAFLQFSFSLFCISGVGLLKYHFHRTYYLNFLNYSLISLVVADLILNTSLFSQKSFLKFIHLNFKLHSKHIFYIHNNNLKITSIIYHFLILETYHNKMQAPGPSSNEEPYESCELKINKISFEELKRNDLVFFENDIWRCESVNMHIFQNL